LAGWRFAEDPARGSSIVDNNHQHCRNGAYHGRQCNEWALGCRPLGEDTRQKSDHPQRKLATATPSQAKGPDTALTPSQQRPSPGRPHKGRPHRRPRHHDICSISYTLPCNSSRLQLSLSTRQPIGASRLGECRASFFSAYLLRASERPNRPQPSLTILTTRLRANGAKNMRKPCWPVLATRPAMRPHRTRSGCGWVLRKLSP
jgi:hypothetical protein